MRRLHARDPRGGHTSVHRLPGGRSAAKTGWLLCTAANLLSLRSVLTVGQGRMTTTPQAFARPKGPHERRAGTGPLQRVRAAGRCVASWQWASVARSASPRSARCSRAPASPGRRRKAWGWLWSRSPLPVSALSSPDSCTRGLTNGSGSTSSPIPPPSRLWSPSSLIGGVVWCASIIATAVLARPRRLDPPRTRALAIFTTLMVVLIGGAAFKGREYALIRGHHCRIFSGGDLKPGRSRSRGRRRGPVGRHPAGQHPPARVRCRSRADRNADGLDDCRLR